MNPYVFIVGCARSGTTLLRRMINAHPHITMTTQSRFIPIFFKERTGLTPEGFVTPELIPKLLEYRRFPKMKVGREELEGLINSDEPVSYPSFVSAIFDLYGQRKGKSLERVMNSIRNGLGMRKAGNRRAPGQPANPHSNAVFTQVHNTL